MSLSEPARLGPCAISRWTLGGISVAAAASEASCAAPVSSRRRVKRGVFDMGSLSL